jgi:hypothetical protein
MILALAIYLHLQIVLYTKAIKSQYDVTDEVKAKKTRTGG